MYIINLIYFLIIFAIIAFFVAYYFIFIKRRFRRESLKISAEVQDIENERKELEKKIAEILSEKENINDEKLKIKDKNKKIWQMSEHIYKAKVKSDELNQQLVKEKEKLENDKKKFEEKNKKLWNQSIAIHKEKERIDILKQEIEEKHHNVTESIRYAKRIQEAILPASDYIKTLLPSSFILYRPKDIVSGDFYWVEQVQSFNNITSEADDIVFFSVIDCTGHGVPGAFMSIFGYSLLNQAFDESKLRKPSDILNFLSTGVLKKLREHSEDIVVKDGMDLVLCALHKQKMLLEFAGVNNPLYLIRGDELLIHKTVKYAIGEPFEERFKGYSNFEVQLCQCDQIYIFSDGYFDQFGGPQKKKFMSRQFRETLLRIKDTSMDAQKIKLEQILDEWRGPIEQYDDITVMCVKI
ncbi:MAG: SpoIIE family protein phosphatase [Bacteroidia bacterium]|nr:SpoIIE family protein phosphatase [Bacteroidia bacterium]